VLTLLGPAVVLVAIVATVRIAISQPDQPATAKTRSRRAPDPGTATSTVPGPATGAARSAGGRAGPASPVIVTTPMPAGFRWTDATPAPKVRSGFALVVILAFLGALLAMAVAGLVAALAVAVQGI